MRKSDNNIEPVSNQKVVEQIKKIKQDPDTDYGYRKMTFALLLLGYIINHKKVYRLMKTMILIITSLLLICNSCDKKDKYYPYESWIMEISNNSGHIVNIQFISNSQPTININTNLLDDNLFTLSSGDNDPVGGELDLISRAAFDTAIITFNDDKRIIYFYNQNLGTYNDSTRNILFKENYVLIESKNKNKKYRYELSESDYQLAE